MVPDLPTVVEIRRQLVEKARNTSVRGGPFVTLSREYGCSGLTVSLLVAELLNDQAPTAPGWRVFGRDLLEQLAEETGLADDVVNDLKDLRPELLDGLLRTGMLHHVPSGQRLRNRIMLIIRALSWQGYAIILGQGGSAATADLDNGLSVRLEAPLAWRIEQISRRESLSPVQAKLAIESREKQRAKTRETATKFSRTPAFDVVFDTSRFTAVQLAQAILAMMRLRKVIA